MPVCDELISRYLHTVPVHNVIVVLPDVRHAADAGGQVPGAACSVRNDAEARRPRRGVPLRGEPVPPRPRHVGAPQAPGDGHHPGVRRRRHTGHGRGEPPAPRAGQRPRSAAAPARPHICSPVTVTLSNCVPRMP